MKRRIWSGKESEIERRSENQSRSRSGSGSERRNPKRSQRVEMGDLGLAWPWLERRTLEKP